MDQVGVNAPGSPIKITCVVVCVRSRYDLLTLLDVAYLLSGDSLVKIDFLGRESKMKFSSRDL